MARGQARKQRNRQEEYDPGALYESNDYAQNGWAGGDDGGGVAWGQPTMAFATINEEDEDEDEDEESEEEEPPPKKGKNKGGKNNQQWQGGKTGKQQPQNQKQQKGQQQQGKKGKKDKKGQVGWAQDGDQGGGGGWGQNQGGWNNAGGNDWGAKSHGNDWANNNGNDWANNNGNDWGQAKGNGWGATQGNNFDATNEAWQTRNDGWGNDNGAAWDQNNGVGGKKKGGEKRKKNGKGGGGERGGGGGGWATQGGTDTWDAVGGENDYGGWGGGDNVDWDRGRRGGTEQGWQGSTFSYNNDNYGQWGGSIFGPTDGGRKSAWYQYNGKKGNREGDGGRRSESIAHFTPGSRTLAFATGAARPTTLDAHADSLSNPAVVDSRGVTLAEAETALYSRDRPVEDRIHWAFSPDKDLRVSDLLYWVQVLSRTIAEMGVQHFVFSRQRGALVANVEYRSPYGAGNEIAFDWVTFEEIVHTYDRTLQESIACYDPGKQVVVLVFLLSNSRRSLAMWRRKVDIPPPVKHAQKDEINSVIKELAEQKLVVTVEKLPDDYKTKKKKWYHVRW